MHIEHTDLYIVCVYICVCVLECVSDAQKSQNAVQNCSIPTEALSLFTRRIFELIRNFEWLYRNSEYVSDISQNMQDLHIHLLLKTEVIEYISRVCGNQLFFLILFILFIFALFSTQFSPDLYHIWECSAVYEGVSLVLPSTQRNGQWQKKTKYTDNTNTNYRESTGYSALPSPPRLMRRAVAAQRTHTHRHIHCLTASVTVHFPRRKRRRR